MATQKRVFVSGVFYHIYNRGTSKQKIFLGDEDKNRFTQLLYLCNGTKSFVYRNLSQKKVFEFSFDKGENLVEICSWVLMDNHFHLLVYLPDNVSGINISSFISRLEAAYLKYFNEKRNRTGNLFEGRFKSILIDSDDHLKYLFSYIHLNPLKMMDQFWKQNFHKLKKVEAYLNDYKFSSYQDLIRRDKRHEAKILSQNKKVSEISKIANDPDKLFSHLPQTPGGLW
jgi:REP element-mobilizing transposase RayT